MRKRNVRPHDIKKLGLAVVLGSLFLRGGDLLSVVDALACGGDEGHELA